MRIIEGLSGRELKVFVDYFQLLDPIDPYQDLIPVDSQVTVAGLTRQEFLASLLGLQQLGLLAKEAMPSQDEWTDSGSGLAWKLTALARQVATLSRVGFEEF